MPKIKFKYFKFPRPAPGPSGRTATLRPLIPVRLHGPKASIDVWALVDSGADDCIFHSEVADAVGIEWKSYPSQDFMGVDASKFAIHFGQATFEVGGYPLISLVGFSEKTVYKAILGQYGFFDKAKIIFNLNQEEIEIYLS